MIGQNKRHIIGLSVLAWWFSFALIVPAQAVDIQRVVSPGGIEAWLVEERSIPLISMEIGFRGGASADPEGLPGVSFMTSALLDEGAGDLDSLSFQKRLEEDAIRLGFESRKDQFYASLNTLSENKASAFEMLKLALTKPRFDEEAVERIRRQIQVLLARNAEDPDTISSLAWYKTAFEGHPYALPRQGTSESVAAITVDHLRDYVAQTFARDQMKIGVVGDIDAETLGPILDDLFSNLPAKSQAKLGTKTVVSDGSLQIIERDIPQSVVMFGGKGLLRKDPDFIPAYVLNYILGGGGFASRLTEEVREKRGLTYGVYTYLVALHDAGAFAGGVSSENDKIKEAMDVIVAEFKRLREEGISVEELENAKTYLTGSYPLRFDSNTKIANQLVGIQIEELGIDYINDRNGLIQAVTPEDIERVAARLFDPDDMVVTIVGKPVGFDDVQPTGSE